MAYRHKHLRTGRVGCATLSPMPSGIKTRPKSLDLTVMSLLDVERERQGMSQTQLGEAVGISQSQVSRVLDGTKPATITEMLRMCAVLGVVASEIFEQAEREVR
jgi:DNA-binding Xre family transcriptional regulator